MNKFLDEVRFRLHLTKLVFICQLEYGLRFKITSGFLFQFNKTWRTSFAPFGHLETSSASKILDNFHDARSIPKLRVTNICRCFHVVRIVVRQYRGWMICDTKLDIKMGLDGDLRKGFPKYGFCWLPIRITYIFRKNDKFSNTQNHANNCRETCSIVVF